MPNTHKTFPRPSSQDGIPHPTHEKYLINPLPHPPWEKIGKELVHPSPLQNTLLRYTEYRVRYGFRGKSHGMLTLYGPPGTGKSDTIRWLADATARMHRTSGNALVVPGATFFDENLGRSQKLVRELFADITLSASRKLTFVLIDDAETILLDRKQSLEKKGEPSDVAKSTTEFLHGLDDLRFGNVCILTTLNLDGVVDFAVEDRSDLTLRFSLPHFEQRLAILRKLLRGLVSERVLVALATATEGWSGRRLNKLEMLAYTKGTARELEALAPEDFLRAAEQIQGSDLGSDEQIATEVKEVDECTTRTSPKPSSLPVIKPRKSKWSWPKRLF